MRLHAGVVARSVRPCRVLVGGYGSPACRDLDFGERFTRLAETFDWPDGVVVEDLSYSAHLVLHRLQELRPMKLVLVGAVARGLDPPGTVRRYRLGASPPDAGEVHASLVEAIGGAVGLDNMLSVVRHFGGLPSETVVVEVEAADSSFGLGFSDETAAAIDPVLDVVREELGGFADGPTEAQVLAATPAAPEPAAPGDRGAAPAAVAAAGPPVPGIEQLFRYAEAHAQLRALQSLAERLPGPARGRPPGIPGRESRRPGGHHRRRRRLHARLPDPRPGRRHVARGERRALPALVPQPDGTARFVDAPPLLRSAGSAAPSTRRS